MARVYPADGPVQETWSFGERQLYEVLRDQLGDDYHVVHSTPWRARVEGGRMRTGEADYIVVHPRHGILARSQRRSPSAKLTVARRRRHQWCIRSSTRSAVMRRIGQRLHGRAPLAHPAARPAQRHPARAGQTELAICDQAIDQHRIGLRPVLHKGWSFDEQRPVAPVQHRFDWRSLVGFVHPASGRTVFHLATSVSLRLFEAELEAFARTVGAGPTKQIVLVLDRAGWHASARLRVPEHVHLLFLPPYSPELQPAEHLWPLTNAALINQHFATIEDQEGAQLARCAALQRRPDLVRSTTRFHWWPKRIHKRRGPQRH